MLRFASFFLVLITLVACTGDGSSRRYDGAGYSLYSETQTPKATRELLNYFDELCGQAGIGAVRINQESGSKSFSCPQPLNSSQYARLMQAGFNDIDLRCDQYLGWIDRKRIEALSYRRSTSALEALIGAGLLIGKADPEAFAALIAAFSFSRDIYDAQNTNLLAALESSTIKTIVYKRQKAFRAAANAHSGQNASRESVVFALRNYLLICTPQTIVLDANTFSRDPSAGSPAALQSDFNEQFRSLSPVRASDSFGTTTPLQKPSGQTCKGRDKVFSDNPENYLCEDIRIAQRYLCFTPGRGLDGAAGANTTNAIKSFELLAYNEAERTADPSKSDGLLSDKDYATLAEFGCQKGEGETYQNIWEAIKFKNNADTYEGIVLNLNKCFPDQEIPQGATLDNLGSSVLRERVHDFRKKFDLNPALNGQMTEGFFQALSAASNNNCTAIN